MADHEHLEMEKMLSVHTTELGAHKEQISDLFIYRDQLQHSMGKLELSVEALKKDQQSWASMLLSNIRKLGDQLTDHCGKVDNALNRVNGLEVKGKEFDWFTIPMNKMQGKLPWFLMGIILIGIASFSVSWDLLRKLIESIGKVFSIFR